MKVRFDKEWLTLIVAALVAFNVQAGPPRFRGYSWKIPRSSGGCQSGQCAIGPACLSPTCYGGASCTSCGPNGTPCPNGTCLNGQCACVQMAPVPVTASAPMAGDALDQVNAKRARLGLRPFIRDEGLTQGAVACAKFRAAHHHHGHWMVGGGDFSFLPPGVQMAAGGAEAPGWWNHDPAWLTCCDDESQWTYAGAGVAQDETGAYYQSLFVK